MRRKGGWALRTAAVAAVVYLVLRKVESKGGLSSVTR